MEPEGDVQAYKEGKQPLFPPICDAYEPQNDLHGMVTPRV